MDTLSKKIISQINKIKADGLYKDERIITSKQDSRILVNDKSVLNFCANNYLGLSSSPQLIDAAKNGLDHWGLGLSSVRFICGTQTIHKKLEHKLSQFLEMEDIFGDLANDPVFREDFSFALKSLWSHGVEKTLQDYILAN